MTNNFLNGVDKYYAGGGGGGNLHIGYNEGAGGNGGGGAGGNVPGSNSGSYVNDGISGTPNTGGGGGGASAGNGGSGAKGGSGGSGVVIFRFVLAENENLPAVSSGTEDYSTKFYNYNSGEALESSEEQIVIGSYEPKILDSNGDELAYNTYTEDSIEYKSYVFTTVGTTSVSLSHDTPVDFMIVAGGGGGSGGRAGSGGGAGGVVVGTGINTITSGDYTITVGEGGAGGSSASSWVADSGSNSEAFGYIAIGGGRGSIAGNGMDGRSIWNIDSNINEDSNGGSGGANENTVGKAIGYHSVNGTFEFSGGSANYENNSTDYPNVIVYGSNGGGHGGDYKGTTPGGGGAGGVGSDGNLPGSSSYNSGAGGVGMTNNFLNGIDTFYA